MNEEKFRALNGLLSRIESEIQENKTEYKGTRQFKPNAISEVFNDKVLKIIADSERAEGDEEFVADKWWYVFNVFANKYNR